MLTEVNGNYINCSLVRIDNGDLSDNRRVDFCERLNNCARCMWNIDYAKTQNLELKPMTKEELEDLRERYGITAKKLRCMVRVRE